MIQLSKNNQCVAYDYTIQRIVMGITYTAHIIYFRLNTQSSNDLIDNLITAAIVEKFPSTTHSIHPIQTDADLAQYDAFLKTNTTLLANYHITTVSWNFSLLMTLAPTVILDKTTPIDIFENIGKQIPLDYATVSKVFNTLDKTPLLAINEHPCLNGITCFVDDKNPDMMQMFFSNGQTNTYASFLVDLNTRLVQTMYSEDSLTDERIIKSEIYKAHNTYEIHKLRMFRDKENFHKAKDIVLNHIQQSQRPTDVTVRTYLKNMDEL